jgi:hypothetical protein
MGAQGPKKHRDLWVIGAVVSVVAGGALAAYFASSKPRVDAQGRVVAHVERLVNSVLERRPKTLRWDVAAMGMALVDRHTLRTAALSGARITFTSGRTWDIGEGTTVTLREPEGGNPEIALEVGIVRPEVPSGAGAVSARVALPGGKVLTLTSKRISDAKTGGGEASAQSLAKVVVEANKPVVIQANDDLAVKIEDAPSEAETPVADPTASRGRRGETGALAGFEIKRGVAVAIKGDGAKEDIALPLRPEIGEVQVVGEGRSRALAVRVRNVEPGVRYQAEIARDPAFTEGRQFFSAAQSEFRFPVAEPGRWFVRVIAIGRGEVESGPSSTQAAEVQVARAAARLDAPVAAKDAGAPTGADAGADAANATQRMPDEPQCARVKGGGSISKKSGAMRGGTCAVAGDTVAATSGAVDLAAAGVGDVRLFAGGRVRVEKIGEEVFSVSLDQGVAEVRAREHPVSVTGALGVRLRPKSSVVTSVRPGEYVYVEGVSGRASVDLGGGHKDLRVGDAFHWSPSSRVRLLHPYRAAGVAVRASGRAEFLAPSDRATLRAEWKDVAEPVDVTVRFGGKVVLCAPTRKGSFAYETHGYGAYAISAVSRGGKTVHDATVVLKRDPWEKIEPATKTFPVSGAMRNAIVDYDTLLPNLRFTWETIAGARKYYFSLATDSGFKHRLLDEEVATPDVTVPSSRFKEKTKVYYWRAVAGGGDADDTRGPFKLTFRFKSNAPSLWIQTPRSHTRIRRGTAFSTSGVAIPKSRLKINDNNVDIDASGRWSATVSLGAGENWVTYEATLPSGRTQRFLRRVEVE